MIVTEADYEAAYNWYVVEHFTTPEFPITPEFFREIWSEMTDEEKAEMIAKAKQ